MKHLSEVVGAFIIRGSKKDHDSNPLSKLVNGKLQIAEDEAEVIRLMFDKYIGNEYDCVMAESAWR